MRSPVLALAVIFLLCGPPTDALKVQVGEFTYSLESVMKLKKLMDKDSDEAAVAPHKLCSHSLLPEEFLPVCEKEEAPEIFVKLVEAAYNLDECELCANPACPGC
ncbi:guanylin-like [Pelodytes ibericus]